MGKKLGEELTDVDKEALRALLLKDGEVYKYSGSQEILSDADITTLMDRYVRLAGPDAFGCVTDISIGATRRTSRRRGETGMRTFSRSSRRGRTASRRPRPARRICLWSWRALPGVWLGRLPWSYLR